MKARVTILLLTALTAAGACAGQASAATTRVPGIDVSRFQGAIDWPSVAGDGIQFAFVAASRGSGKDCAVAPKQCGADPFYATNYAAARAAGIRVGPYHRAFIGGGSATRMRRDARAEADVFIRSVGGLQAGDLHPALDLETPFASTDPFKLRTWTRTWLNRVRAALGREPIIYTNLSSWTLLGNPTSFARRGNALWVANWKVRSPLMPASNWAGKGWRFWQYSSSGRVDGIKGNVDLDWLQGGYAGISLKR